MKKKIIHIIGMRIIRLIVKSFDTYSKSSTLREPGGVIHTPREKSVRYATKDQVVP